jgi:hypothetical protein
MNPPKKLKNINGDDFTWMGKSIHTLSSIHIQFKLSYEDA